jgi:hypothetical protein
MYSSYASSLIIWHLKIWFLFHYKHFNNIKWLRLNTEIIAVTGVSRVWFGV